MVQKEETDFLVIGSGIAGLSFAIKARELGKVIIVTKKQIMVSSTNLAQGGIASVVSQDDSFQLHIDDTVNVGHGLSDKKAVKVLVENGPREIQWLISKGVEFDREQGKLSLSREGGHSVDRIIHAGDYSGMEIERAGVSCIQDMDIDVRENFFALDLIIQKGECYGAKVLDIKDRELINFLSRVTVLATGGIGQLYKNTSNPDIATGDGIAMALRAGASIMDMEFVQFHPTTLNIVDAPNFLLSETLRGEGGVLRNVNGDAFMERYKHGDLAPRDIVSRAVFEELKKGPVFLDISHKDEVFIRKRFPMIYNECLKYGFDLTVDKIPVIPAAHYICGGIKVDLFGESSIRRLFSFGESSCTGVHGANRLASNSLLESLVFSSLAIKRVPRYLKSDIRLKIKTEPRVEVIPESKEEKYLRNKLRNLTWKYVSIVRKEKELDYALKEVEQLERRGMILLKDAVNSRYLEYFNMIAVAKTIIRAALTRKESRGTHYLIDYPYRDDANWLGHIVFEKNEMRMEAIGA